MTDDGAQVLAAIPVGATAAQPVLVTRELTVAHFHPDMPEVYGTPMMIYLMEVAAAAAIAPYLPAGWVTVGTKVDIEHLAPTPVGRTVTATAAVLAVAGKTVSFAVEAHDGVRLVGRGRHQRGAIELEKFRARLSADGRGRIPP